MTLDLSEYVLGLVHTEQVFGGSTTVLCHHESFPVDLGDLESLEGQEVTLGLGLVTGAGNEYSNVGPLWINSARLTSAGGILLIEISCFDEWQKIESLEVMGDSVAAAPYWEGTKTIFEIFQELLSGVVDVTLDSSDGVIDSYQPYYYTRVTDTKGEVLADLLSLTNCGVKMRQDGLHIFDIPALDPYDYTYELSGDHVFFSHVQDERLTFPNRVIVVDKLPDESGTYHTYSGTASDADSYGQLGYYVTRIIRIASLSSNAQAASFAEAILANYQRDKSTGVLVAPLNCGQELYDRVKVIDSRSGQTWTGYIGTIRHIYDTDEGVYNIEIGLGGIGRGLPAWPETESLEFESDLVGHHLSIITAKTTELIPGTPYPTEGRVTTLWEYTPAEYEAWYRTEEMAYAKTRALIPVVKPGTDEFYTVWEFYEKLGLTMLEKALVARGTRLPDIESYLRSYGITPTSGVYERFALTGEGWKEKVRAFMLGSSYSRTTREIHQYNKPRYNKVRKSTGRQIIPGEIRDTQIDWGTGAGQVSAVDVPIADAGEYYTGTDVEAALQELGVSGTYQTLVHAPGVRVDSNKLQFDKAIPRSYTFWIESGQRLSFDKSTEEIRIRSA